jgi:NADH-quinone oxidoreductase subunit M
MNILTLLIFIPVLFGIIIMLLPSSMRNSFKYITLGATLNPVGHQHLDVPEF